MAERRYKKLRDAALRSLLIGFLYAIKQVDRRRTVKLAAALMRRIGPLFKEHDLGRRQLRAAFPEKSDAEIEKILTGVWDNLGRVGAEFAHLDEFRIESTDGLIPAAVNISPESIERARRIREAGKPVLSFVAHLANWEIAGLAVKSLGFNSAILYRRPNIKAVSDLVVRMRAPLMGELVPAGLEAPVKLARLLQSGVHVGMLVDQYMVKGVDVTFFGRPCKANPLIALLARQLECPIHGLRSVRLPDGHSFWGEITEPIALPRDADGRIDVQGTMQAITSVIEGWIREHPEQWLWLHRRWR
jgi:KDO2-lipid IV(A) lauroyltransferase